MDNLLSCNLGSYHPWPDMAYDHLPTLGVKYVEIGVPAPDQAAAVKARLDAAGLSALTVMAPCPVAEADLAERFKPVFEAANALGAKVIFVSVRADQTPLDTVYERLRAVGDLAEAAGVKVGMETHPDLCDNGDKMVATMTAVGHPAIGINFDTANIYYYNHAIDGVEEVRKALPHIVSVHLKDTLGGYHNHAFPTLGQGIVNFPAIFKLLNERGLHGPFTMELEGMAGVELDQAGKAQSVADSVAYLRGAGLVP